MYGTLYFFVIFFRTIKFQNAGKRKIVLEEEIVDETEPEEKVAKTGEGPVEDRNQAGSSSYVPKTNFTTKILKGVIAKKSKLSGLVKIKKDTKNQSTENEDNKQAEEKREESTNQKEPSAEVKSSNSNGLSLLGAYSDSESSDG